MNLFEELESAARKQLREGDLPQWLADPVLEVAHHPERFQQKEYLVEMLLDQVSNFDTYGEAGCCKWAFDHEDVKRTLDRLKEG